MTPTSRFSAALSAIGWGCSALAARLGVNERTVRRWASGQNHPPAAVLAWLERVAAFLAADPGPGGVGGVTGTAGGKGHSRQIQSR
jgi:ribosome-binding protein aMBF1 (putative translation factor)